MSDLLNAVFMITGMIVVAVLLILGRRWAAEVLFQFATFLPWRRDRPIDKDERRFAEVNFVISVVIMVVLAALALTGVISSSTGTRVYPR